MKKSSKGRLSSEEIREQLSHSTVHNLPITKELEKSFMDYAMSVIVSRALPDVRDGLKPVHRRILFAGYGLSMFNDKPYKKSARLVGEVIVSITLMVIPLCMKRWLEWPKILAWDIC